MKEPHFKFLFRSYLRKYYVYLYRVFTRHLRRSFRFGGARWRSWLRHLATRRKVAGSIPDYVIGIFLWHGLVSTQPLVPRVFPGGEACRCVVLTTLPPSYADYVGILGASTSWSPQGLSWPATGLLCLYHSLGHSVQMGCGTHVYRGCVP
jgi:hypothetical protein